MSSPFLNPDTYLNHWTPDNAFQIEVARNLYLAVCGALIWDILVYIPVDIKILRLQQRIRAVNVCFVTSRLFALFYVLLSALAKIVPLKNCDPMFISLGCCLMLSLWSSSFLFLRRVEAVYPNNKWVKVFFSVLWFINGGIEITVVLGVRATHVPDTLHCIDTQPEPYVLGGGLAPVVFDTLVFLAISYKIVATYSTVDTKVSWRTLFSGKALPRLSRAILQGGQQYYLITVGVYIILVILLGLHLIPPVYQNMFAFPSVSLTASMACRVYRNIKLLDLEEITLHPLSDLNFATQGPTPNSSSTTSDNTRYSTRSTGQVQRVDPTDHGVRTSGKSRETIMVTRGSEESGIRILKPEHQLNPTSSLSM